MVGWKKKLGERLRELRQEANRGKGITHEKAAATIKKTEAYVVRLETSMEKENPTLGVLEDLVTLYGKEIGDLFRWSSAWKKQHGRIVISMKN